MYCDKDLFTGSTYIKEQTPGSHCLMVRGRVPVSELYADMSSFMRHDLGHSSRTIQLYVDRLQEHRARMHRMFRTGGILQADGYEIGFGDESPVGDYEPLHTAEFPFRVRVDELPEEIRALTTSEVSYQKLYVVPEGLNDRIHLYPLKKEGIGVEIRGKNGETMLWFSSKKLGMDRFSKVLEKYGEYLFGLDAQGGIEHVVSSHSFVRQALYEAPEYRG